MGGPTPQGYKRERARPGLEGSGQGKEAEHGGGCELAWGRARAGRSSADPEQAEGQSRAGNPNGVTMRQRGLFQL